MTMFFSSSAESLGIHIGTGTRFGLAGAFDRYCLYLYLDDDGVGCNAFTILQPLWAWV